MKEMLEETHKWYTTTLQDKVGTPLTAANIATLTLTITDKDSSSVVNSRDQLDVRNGGAWDQDVEFILVDSVSTLEFTITPEDATILNTEGRDEIRVVLWEGTTAGTPSYSFKHIMEFKVMNLKRVNT